MLPSLEHMVPAAVPAQPKLEGQSQAVATVAVKPTEEEKKPITSTPVQDLLAQGPIRGAQHQQRRRSSSQDSIASNLSLISNRTRQSLAGWSRSLTPAPPASPSTTQRVDPIEPRRREEAAREQVELGSAPAGARATAEPGARTSRT